MRGPGYYLVTDLLVAAGHTREQASAAIARIEWDVLDAVQGTVSSIGVRFPDDRDGDGYVDGWHDSSIAVNARLAELAERSRVEAKRGGIAMPSAPNPPIPWSPAPPSPELRDVRAVMEDLFHGLVGERPHDEEFTDHVLYAVRWLVTEPGYPARLTAFTHDREPELRQLYRDYGPGSAHDTDPGAWPAPAYVLARQPESLILAELLTHRPLALAGAMEDTPPGIYLADMATAWPHRR
ncbi:hypothetical protein AB0K43_31185 [Kitasatospora sp. NPDC049258]|uniref:hypothetical protein n=1 Tax=Kitasatospora sp. NPDC049258 TaxID=3155394 RepID=UPI00343914DB